MKHIVVGAAGFTGRRIVQRLTELGQEIVLVDIRPLDPPVIRRAPVYIRADVRNATDLDAIPLGPEDVVHHLAARQYHERVPRTGRDAWFAEVNVQGTRNILKRMERAGCHRMVYFSTDMVYGPPKASPVPATHEQSPVGPYGTSKKESEQVCREFRDHGMSITILRPRFIVGPGRLGVLEKLFALIHRGLPVPLIGTGNNRYQMVSVHDCASAAISAWQMGLPNGEFNLGSDNPPQVKSLLKDLIRRVGSRSFLVPTPAGPLKALLAALDAIGLTLLYHEQFAIADAEYIVDISKTKSNLGWKPRYDDNDMLTEAYQFFLAKQAIGVGKG